MSRQSVSSDSKEQLLSLSRRLVKPILVLGALVALAVFLSACAIIREDSLRLSQPAGIGPVKVHFAICTEPAEKSCKPNESEGQSQYMLGIAVPKGSTAPATITAAPINGGAPIVFNRNEEVTRAIEQLAQENEGGYPPAGTESAGYLSAVFDEETGAIREWHADPEFGLPTAADGGSFGGPFTVLIVYGWRKVDEAHPASRPVDCFEPIGEPPTDSTALCGAGAQGQLATSDLKIGAPATTTPVFVGGRAPVSFNLDFAGTVDPRPTFALAATTTLQGGATTMVTGAGFTPGPVAGDGHRSPAATSSVMVAVPKTAKPGLYDVTLTATAPQGGSVSQVAKLRVTKPKLKLGGVKLNKATGTATVSVGVPSAGTLTVSGKGIAKAKKKAKKAKTVKVIVKATGKAKAALAELGKAQVRAKISFKPSSGITVKKTKPITLFIRP